MTELELQEYFSNDFTTMADFENKVMSYIFADHYEKDLTHKSLVESGDYKPKANDCIKDILQCGSISSLDATDYGYLYEVVLADRTNVARSRVNIMQAVKSILETYAHALVVFHYENTKDSEWRFTYMHKGSSQKDSTQVKRYTYLCGKGHPSHTVSKNFITLKKSDFSDEAYLQAFSLETLTKEFFTQIFKWYDSWACKIALFPSKNCIASHAELTTENNNLHLIRLITRIMFVWFIKQKDLIPSWVFNRAELESLLSDPDLESEKKGNYYNAVLQNLFFGALNKKIEERSFAEKSFDGIPNEQYGIKSYFRDDNKSSFFTVSHKEMQEHFEGVPFLNGGLFECLDYDVPHGKDSHKVHYVDGFSRNAERRAFVPNALFWSEDEANLGLIPIFCRYNFTVEESTPNDVQVALDPELLGKIFENLLGTFNPETKESARKESGSFYTPREIVSYMVNTSLASYLHEKVSSVSEETIEKLTSDNKSDDEDIQLTESQIDELRKALVNIKIIDPACGSGAFPMGILNKLVEIHGLLNRLSASTHSDKSLYIKKGQFVNYTPNDELRINAEYLGEQKFRLSVNGNTENPVYTSQELAIHVKDIINKYNKKLHKNTIANLFSQGRIDDGKSFNSIKTKQEILQIVDVDSKEIIWQYKTYNVENKFRKYRTEGSEQTASTETETEDGLLNYNSLYNLKTQIIQDSIFGVDIQPIAVQICKLRFFISLICEQPKTGSKENNYGYNPLPNLETKFVAANTLIGKAKKSDAMALFADQRIDNITKELLEIRKAHFSAKTAQEKKENREKDEQLRTELSKLLEEDNVYNPEDARQLAQWNPYDQTADASPFFDAEWMFGVKDGFDIVIGNPPYVNANELKRNLGEKKYKDLKSLFVTAKGTVDYYIYFFEKGISLLKSNGLLSYITPNKYLCANYGVSVRKYFLDNTRILKLWDVSNSNCFDAAVYPIVTTLVKTCECHNDYEFSVKTRKEHTINYKSKSLSILPENIWGFLLSDNFALVKKIIEKSDKLTSVCKINATSTAGEADKFHDYISENSRGIKLINTGTIDPYITLWGKRELVDKGCKYLKPYLENDKSILGENRYSMYNSPKIVFAKMANCTEAFFDQSGDYSSINTNCLYDFKLSPLFVLGWVHSSLFNFIYETFFDGLRMAGGYLPYSAPYLSCMYIPKIHESSMEPIIDLVDKILAAKKADNTADITVLEHKIDELVYKLYGLTDEEIAIVEGK